MYSCLTALRRKRSQAGKGCTSQVGMRRRNEKKAAIDLPHPGGLASALDAPEAVLRSSLSVQHCAVCVHSRSNSVVAIWMGSEYGWAGRLCRTAARSPGRAAVEKSAGGRLWPASAAACPFQFGPLACRVSRRRETVERGKDCESALANTPVSMSVMDTLR